MGAVLVPGTGQGWAGASDHQHIMAFCPAAMPRELLHRYSGRKHCCAGCFALPALGPDCLETGRGIILLPDVRASFQGRQDCPPARPGDNCHFPGFAMKMLTGLVSRGRWLICVCSEQLQDQARGQHRVLAVSLPNPSSTERADFRKMALYFHSL